MSKDESKVVSLTNARDKEKNTDKNDTSQTVYCSFCERPNHQVIKMVKGPGINICSECVMICTQYLILEDRIPSEEARKVLDALWHGSRK